MKARWTRWGGGHGALDAYGLEFGHYFSVTVQKKFGSELWRIEINMRFAGECETKEEAFALANQQVAEAARDFVEDWAIWTVSQRYPHRLPKGW